MVLYLHFSSQNKFYLSIQTSSTLTSTRTMDDWKPPSSCPHLFIPCKKFPQFNVLMLFALTPSVSPSTSSLSSASHGHIKNVRTYLKIRRYCIGLIGAILEYGKNFDDNIYNGFFWSIITWSAKLDEPHFQLLF